MEFSLRFAFDLRVFSHVSVNFDLLKIIPRSNLSAKLRLSLFNFEFSSRK